MAFLFQPPQVFSAIDMFTFWIENLRRQKPHLIIKKFSSHKIELWYEAKQELEYLKIKNLQLDAEVQKLEIEDKNIEYFTSTTKEIFKLKKEIADNKNKIKSLEKQPVNSKEMIMDYKTFKEIITCFNKKAADSIINGKLVYLGNNLGYSQIRKIIPVKRSNKMIDWKASYEYKKELLSKGIKIRENGSKEGEPWLLYRNNTWYLRWAWVKHYTSTHYMTCKVKNNRVYAFYPTNTNSATGTGKEKVPGNKTKLALANQADPLLHTRYFTINRKDAKREIKKEEKLEEAA